MATLGSGQIYSHLRGSFQSRSPPYDISEVYGFPEDLAHVTKRDFWDVWTRTSMTNGSTSLQHPDREKLY